MVVICDILLIHIYLAEAIHLYMIPLKNWNRKKKKELQPVVICDKIQENAGLWGDVTAARREIEC